MNNIQIFSNPDFGDVRTVVIDGDPWFVSSDVSKALGYSKTDGMTRLVDEDDRKNISSSDLGEQVYKQSYTIGIVNESGLYAAIFGSKLGTAKKFKKWVTSEVLPQIRQTGSYGQPLTLQQQVQTIAQGTTELYQQVGEVREEVKTVKAEVEEIKNDLPVLPVEADKIVKAVKKKGVEVMGGKSTPAYNDRSTRQKAYNDIYAHLKHNFNVKTYKAIRRRDIDKALQIIEEYKLPLYLKEMIDDANAQLGMDLSQEDKENG